MYKEKLYCIAAIAKNDLVAGNQISKSIIQALNARFLIIAPKFFIRGTSIKDPFRWLKNSIREIFITVCQFRNAANSPDSNKIIIFRSLRNKIHNKVDKDKIDLKDLNGLTFIHSKRIGNVNLHKLKLGIEG